VIGDVLHRSGGKGTERFKPAARGRGCRDVWGKVPPKFWKKRISLCREGSMLEGYVKEVRNSERGGRSSTDRKANFSPIVTFMPRRRSTHDASLGEGYGGEVPSTPGDSTLSVGGLSDPASGGAYSNGIKGIKTRRDLEAYLMRGKIAVDQRRYLGGKGESRKKGAYL